MKKTDAKKPVKKASAQTNAGWEKTWSVLKLIGRYVYNFRALIISIPVVVIAIILACRNMAQLPDSVGINLLANGDYSFMVPKIVAVLTPVVITAFCTLLTMCSKRMLYPWIVSIFTLVLPILIWITNVYPV